VTIDACLPDELACYWLALSFCSAIITSSLNDCAGDTIAACSWSLHSISVSGCRAAFRLIDALLMGIAVFVAIGFKTLVLPYIDCRWPPG